MSEAALGQRRAEFRRAGEPIGRELLQRLGHGGGHIGRHRFPEFGDRLGVLGNDLHDDLLRRVPHVGRLAGQHFVKHRPQ